MTIKTHEQYIKDVAKINFDIEVLGKYVGSKIRILHKCKVCGYEWMISPNSILMGRSCPACSKIRKAKLQTKVHKEYMEELSIKNPTIEVVEEYINAKTKILHRCKICGHEWKPAPYNVLYNGTKCPLCTHKCIGNAPKYENSIWASKYREYFSKYMTEEQMKSYMPNSVKKIELPCPQCNHVKKISPADLLYYGYGCSYCSDGISYPNKFIRAFIEQLPVVNIQNEFSPKWCVFNGNKCRYDIYFEYNNQCYIIEMDGSLGHGNRTFNNLKDTIGVLRDKEKERLAQEHNIIVIRIDSQISEQEYIKSSIIKSELNNLFDLTNINWAHCDERATSSNVYEAASLWNDNLSIKQISNILHVHTATITRYLRQANKLGLCNYSHEESSKRGYKEVSKTNTGRVKNSDACAKISNSKKGKQTKADNPNARKVIRLCDETIYDYLAGAAYENNMHKATMIKYCKTHNGFMYYDEWLTMKNDLKF